MRKPPFHTIKQFDARGEYPGNLTELPKYEHPTYFHPLGTTSSDLNDPQNLAKELARLEASYNKDKADYVPIIIIIYNYGLTLIGQHV